MNVRLSIAVLVGISIGFTAGYLVSKQTCTADSGQALLVRDLSRIQLAANGLRTIQEGGRERTEKLLWFTLESALQSAEEGVRTGARLPEQQELAHLRGGMRRAQRVAATAARTDLVQRLLLLEQQVSSD